MFTGIVQALGTVRSIRNGSAGVRLALNAPALPRPIPLGSSICVSGVCLTVTACDSSNIEFDVIPETLSRSTLGALRVGSSVNLERALRAGDPLDGHTVQGHVDGTARVRRIRTGPGGHEVFFETDASLLPFIIPKGSIALDGVSLTIASVDGDSFSAALIPTTLAVTTLGALQPGNRVNLETDILARTIVTTLQRWQRDTGLSPVESSGTRDQSAPPLTIDSLREKGW